MTLSPTPFADLLAARTRHDDRVAFDVPDDWLQGRTTYGGLTAALAAQAMHDVAGAAWPADVRLRVLQTSFVGPVLGGPVEVAVAVLREGKSVRQVQAHVISEGRPAAVLVGVYGSPRSSAVAPLRPRQRSVAVGAEAAPRRAFVPGRMPAFLQHFGIGWAEGGLPGSGSDSWHNSLHLRLLGDRPDEIDPDVLTVLLADLPPTPAASQLSADAPASSVTWALELLPLATRPNGADWWRIDTEARSADGAYVNHSSTLWTPGGEAAAIGHQLVTVYG